MTANEDELLDLAKEVRSRAYAPFSGYRVGAAILDGDGNVHSGCNVENAAYPEGICAETNAIGSMVAAGGKRIARIVIVGGRDGLEACTPCGGCRQRIREFADDDTVIVVVDADGGLARFTIDALLPGSFRLS